MDRGNQEHLETTGDGNLPEVLTSPGFKELWFPDHELSAGAADLATLTERVKRWIAVVIAE